jgi:hypothetical protein
VYHLNGWPDEASSWKAPVEDDQSTKGLNGFGYVSPLWTNRSAGVYALAKAGPPGHADLLFFEFETGVTRRLLSAGSSAVGVNGTAISPDGLAIQ